MRDTVLLGLLVGGGLLGAGGLSLMHYYGTRPAPSAPVVATATQPPVVPSASVAASASLDDVFKDADARIKERDRRWALCERARGIPTMTFYGGRASGLLCLDPQAVIAIEGAKP